MAVTVRVSGSQRSRGAMNRNGRRKKKKKRGGSKTDRCGKSVECVGKVTKQKDEWGKKKTTKRKR